MYANRVSNEKEQMRTWLTDLNLVLPLLGIDANNIPLPAEEQMLDFSRNSEFRKCAPGQEPFLDEGDSDWEQEEDTAQPKDINVTEGKLY
jgi:hypothetical protein